MFACVNIIYFNMNLTELYNMMKSSNTISPALLSKHHIFKVIPYLLFLAVLPPQWHVHGPYLIEADMDDSEIMQPNANLKKVATFTILGHCQRHSKLLKGALQPAVTPFCPFGGMTAIGGQTPSGPESRRLCLESTGLFSLAHKFSPRSELSPMGKLCQ
jgi:hypothetical protein